MPARRVLIVDDEANMRVVLSDVFSDAGYAIETASTGKEAIDAIEAISADAVVLDLKLPDMSGIDVFREAKRIRPGIIVVIVTAYSSVDTAIEAMKMGAFDYITKPFKVEKLLMVIGNALEAGAGAPCAGRAVPGVGHPDDPEFDGVVGSTREMRQVVEMVQDIAPTNATVLIYGESGTGKELVARYVHKKSLRASRPFVKVNCAAIPETLLESEMFGHERGAFTNAIARRIGRFEMANPGTLFLDEVGEMSLAMQAKLLRVLQDKEFERVGGSETIKVDVRVIAATNKDLRQEIATGAFREDLYYRLSVVPLCLPPLRERREDIPTLCARFIEKYNAEFGRHVRAFSPEAQRLLREHDWPGNIRELENVVARAVLLCREDTLTPEHLRLTGAPINATPALDPGLDQCTLSLEDIERRHIKSVLEQTADNRTKAAKILKITRRTLLNKIKKYGLQ
ncbi:MAG: sigma-54 dependent transcriptional regulator [Firmicutes bacterium]|jgi:DNA-binding NtrC family response regulator|nr:sigma-54 dependent transcriptional regulator [Bacillota bacterium]